MSDLTKRLRDGEDFYAESSLWFNDKLCSDVEAAADRIDKLELSVAFYQGNYEQSAKDIDELEAENTRLREALTEWLDWVEWRVRKTDLDINDHMSRLYAQHVSMCPECTDSKTSKVLGVHDE